MCSIHSVLSVAPPVWTLLPSGSGLGFEHKRAAGPLAWARGIMKRCGVLMPVFHSPVSTSCSLSAAKEEVGKRHENCFLWKDEQFDSVHHSTESWVFESPFSLRNLVKILYGIKRSLWSMTDLARGVSKSSVPSTERRKQEFARCEPGSCPSVLWTRERGRGNLK